MKEGKVVRAWQLSCTSRRGADTLRSSRSPEMDGGVYSKVTSVVVWSVSCAQLQPQGLQHIRLPCPSLSPGVAQIHIH